MNRGRRIVPGQLAGPSWTSRIVGTPLRAIWNLILMVALLALQIPAAALLWLAWITPAWYSLDGGSFARMRALWQLHDIRGPDANGLHSPVLFAIYAAFPALLGLIGFTVASFKTLSKARSFRAAFSTLLSWTVLCGLFPAACELAAHWLTPARYRVGGWYLVGGWIAGWILLFLVEKAWDLAEQRQQPVRGRRLDN